MNIKVFNEQFKKNYRFLYDHNDNVAGFREAVDEFDTMILNPKFKSFVNEFVEFRGDYISSDREASAFMFTYYDLLEA